MSFKKLRMGKEEIFEVKILDCFGGKIGNWKVMKSDFPKLYSILSQKYGLKKSSDYDWALR